MTAELLVDFLQTIHWPSVTANDFWQTWYTIHFLLRVLLDAALLVRFWCCFFCHAVCLRSSAFCHKVSWTCSLLCYLSGPLIFEPAWPVLLDAAFLVRFWCRAVCPVPSVIKCHGHGLYYASYQSHWYLNPHDQFCLMPLFWSAFDATFFAVPSV